MTSDEAEAVLTYQQLQTTAVLSGPTSTTEEKLILTPTKGSTITPTQNKIIISDDNCMKIIIVDSAKRSTVGATSTPNKIDITTPITIRINIVLAVLVTGKQIH